MSLKQFKADIQYLNENYESLKSEHPDEFIVIQSGQVIASGSNLQTVLSEARRKIGENVSHSVIEFLGTRKVEMVV